MLRPVNHAARPVSYTQQTRTDHPTNTDYKEDSPHIEALQNLVPQIAAKSRNAANVDRVEVLYYQQKHVGRRCSCIGFESQPDALCPICWGVGIVGGYDKYGCHTDLFDFSAPFVCSNVDVDFVARPAQFRLNSVSSVGFVEGELQIMTPSVAVDLVQTIGSGAVTAFIRSPVDADWVPLTEVTLGVRRGFARLGLRVMFYASSVPATLSHVLVRLRLLKDVTLVCDQPRQTESKMFSEFGVINQYSTGQFFFPADRFVSFSSQDWFIRLRDMNRFKIIDVNINSPLNIPTSIDCNARLVQPFDKYIRIP
jgi:hypothetical protein